MRRGAKSVSDRYLIKLYREAVLVLHHGCCHFCGVPADIFVVDVHHIVHRGAFVLRWDPKNGIPACRYTHSRNQHLFNGKSCHNYADSPAGQFKLREVLDFDYLDKMALYTKPQWLSEQGITENEFRERARDDLKMIINLGLK